MLAAPFATHILAQLGADVIKLEPPAGDSTRSLVRGGPSGTLIAYSRGKKSLCADLRTDQGKALFRRLLAATDVLVHNLAPDSARRLNVTYEECLEINPKLVYCQIRGYGAGPLENELASNPVAEAATGRDVFRIASTAVPHGLDLPIMINSLEHMLSSAYSPRCLTPTATGKIAKWKSACMKPACTSRRATWSAYS